MFAIIVGTHGLFAEELVHSCEMICGEQKNVRAVTLVPGEGPDDVVKKYEEAIKELDCSGGVLFLNDLFGGSPYNAACRLVIANEAYGIVTGVNLPMLIAMCRAACSSSTRARLLSTMTTRMMISYEDCIGTDR